MAKRSGKGEKCRPCFDDNTATIGNSTACCRKSKATIGRNMRLMPPNTPRAHIGHTAGRKIAQTQQGTAPGRSKALHDVKKTNGAPPCHAATHREVCGKKNVILP